MLSRSPNGDIDVAAFATEVEGRFASAFVRARKPLTASAKTMTAEGERGCCGPSCCHE